MIVKNIELNNYRNYLKETAVFENGLNVVVGKNAQGKTNLLESIYYCCLTKSLRTSKERDLILFGKDSAKIKLQVQKNFGNVGIEINLFKNQKKAIKINEMTVLRVGDLLGTLQAVYFSPDELKLVKESPEYRRRFLDISISQFNKSYFYSLLRYEKILAQRNKLLKSAASLAQIKPSLAILTEQIAAEGAKIVLARREFVANLQQPLLQMHEFLTSGQENIEAEYVGAQGGSFAELKDNLLKELLKNERRDFEQRFTTTGPHRDDLKILVSKIDIRQFGSQGQQRTATLSLKLSELIILEEQSGEKPVLLLDDVLSELDRKRRQKLIELAKKYQTILAATEFNSKKNVNIIKIEKGKIVK